MSAAATIDEMTLADDPARWAALGFDVSGEICRIGAVGLRLAGTDAGTGITGWSVRDLERTELDGLPTERSDAPLADPAPAHPNGVLAIDHIVAMSPSLDRSVAALERAGLDLRRVREEPTPAGAPRQAFFRLGAEILELVQEPEGVVERAGGPDRAARFWGLALATEDIYETVEQLGEHVGGVRPAVQPGRWIATVKRSAGLCVPVALMTPAESAARR